MEIEIERYQNNQTDQKMQSLPDFVAIEEPLEIRLSDHDGEVPLSITMRTPGNDRELACGFLWSEGILQSPSQIIGVSPGNHTRSTDLSSNRVVVQVDGNLSSNVDRLKRNFYTTSSCGVCGKSSLEALQIQKPRFSSAGTSLPFQISSSLLQSLPRSLRMKQEKFAQTGGLHGAALFTEKGEIDSVFEDVGRHNAVDKLIGAKVLNGELPLNSFGLLLSGRASFELLQKAIMAGIPLVASVGAPSSLAVQVAKEFNITLVGFLSESKFNLYSGSERLFVQ